MKRRIDLDILKFISLLFIILAHVHPPKIIFQLRNFDVVLLIIISAYLGLITLKKNKYFDYLKKRFMRLVIPTYVFLIVFFLIAYVFNLCELNWSIFFNAFILENETGIGYVWIIRIYFIIAILIPLCKNILDKYNDKKVIILTVLLYITYEVICFTGIFNNSLLCYLFAYFIPCFCLIIISYYLFKANNKKLIIFALINLVFFVIIMISIYYVTGEIKSTQVSKYPFRLYYLSYGLFISTILIILFKSKKMVNLFNNRFVIFISRNSLWIYLWHILIIYVLKQYNLNFIIKYLIIIFFAVFITYIQNLIIYQLEKRGMNKSVLKIFQG